MPFDTLTMATMAEELRSTLIGAQVQKVIQPSEMSVALGLYLRGRHWLLLSADARHARVHLSGDKFAKAFSTPSSFIMLLRKHLEGARLTEVAQVEGERVLILTFIRDCHSPSLVAEVMGKHSNIMLLDEDGTVLGAIKIVPPRLSRVRPVLPGRPYHPPPEQNRDDAFGTGPRLDPRKNRLEIRSLWTRYNSLRARDGVLGLLSGVSPFLADQIVRHAQVDPNARLGDVDIDALLRAAHHLLLSPGNPHPTTFRDNRGRMDFAPYVPVAVDEVEVHPTLSAAVDAVVTGLESRDALAGIRRSVAAEIEKRRVSVERRIDSLQQGLAASGAADDVMLRGQLLLAYGHLTPTGDRLHIQDLDLSIPIDPRLTLTENAEHYFRRYRKLRDAASKIPHLLAGAQSDLDRLADLAGFVTIASSEADLQDLRREIEVQQVETKKPERRRGPVRFRQGNTVAMLGRNARENEEVTFRRADRNDLWLHARGRTGAHVVLHGEPVSDDVVVEAAALAAYFSEGRTDTAVDVDVTEVRHVRKIPGAAPGRVTYREFQTVRVAPGLGRWEKA